MTLPPVPDSGTLAATRAAWHTLAEQVLAAARYRVTCRIGLRATPGGFGTPRFGDDELRVDGRTLIVTRGGRTTSHPITTVAAAATAAGIVPGAPAEVYTPATSVDPDAPLTIDADASAALAAWFELGSALLEALRATATADEASSEVQLWPEHFDLGLELGRDGERATYGASAGDALHPLPYLYVTRWPGVPDDPFWNEGAFPGASVGYRELVEAPDATTTGRAFYAEARRIVTRRPGRAGTTARRARPTR